MTCRAGQAPLPPRPGARSIPVPHSTCQGVFPASHVSTPPGPGCQLGPGPESSVSISVSVRMRLPGAAGTVSPATPEGGAHGLGLLSVPSAGPEARRQLSQPQGGEPSPGLGPAHLNSKPVTRLRPQGGGRGADDPEPGEAGVTFPARALLSDTTESLVPASGVSVAQPTVGRPWPRHRGGPVSADPVRCHGPSAAPASGLSQV